MKLSKQLELKYEGYRQNGHALFTATLSTYVQSESYARSDRMRYLWDEHFIRRIRKILPYKLKDKIDYDFVIELSPDYFYHFHGLLAMSHEAADRFWKNGALNKELRNAYDSFQYAGKYRPCKINSYLIEPYEQNAPVGDWTRYITKTPEYISIFRE